MISYKRGDVILVRFPHTDLRTYSKRPALIIQDEMVETDLPQKVVTLITSNLDRKGKTRILVSKDSEEGQEMGLLTDSVIVADNIATVLIREIDKTIGSCSTNMPDVDGALRKVLRL